MSKKYPHRAQVEGILINAKKTERNGRSILTIELASANFDHVNLYEIFIRNLQELWLREVIVDFTEKVDSSEDSKCTS